MVSIEECLIIFLYITLIVLVIFLIAFVIRLMKTLNKVDNILDDANRKMHKVDGLFDIIDHTTDYAASLSDKIINAVTIGINKLFNRRDD